MGKKISQLPTGGAVQAGTVIPGNISGVSKQFILNGFTSTATSGGTLTLTYSSNQNQQLTGSSNHTVVLPDTNTLALGTQFWISNKSTGTITVNTSSGTLVLSMASLTTARFTATSIVAQTWTYTYLPSQSGITGTGSTVRATSATLTTPTISNPTVSTGTFTSPTLVTPALGTPASGTLTNCTGLPISTGVSGLGADVATFLATPSSANLRTAITDETGTGVAVFSNSPTIASATLTSPTMTTPTLGTPASGTLTNCTGLPISTGLASIDTNIPTFLITPSSANLRAALTDETGTGVAVFSNSPTIASPTLTTPSLGVATATSINFGQDALNYYDEGTFTPTVTFSTPGDVSVVYTTQTGYYTRVGNACTIYVDLAFTPTHTTAAGTFTVASLPFTAKSTGAATGAVGPAVHSANLTYAAGVTSVHARVATNSATAFVVGVGSATAAVAFSVTQYPSTTSQVLRFTTTYLI